MPSPAKRKNFWLSKKFLLEENFFARSFKVFKSRNCPWWYRITAILTIIYMILPCDLVHDWIPFLGLVDDVTLGLIVFYVLENQNKELLPQPSQTQPQI